MYVRIAHAGRPCGPDVRAQEQLTDSTVESNMKSEHNLYLACEDTVLSSFALSLVLVLPS